MDKSEHYAMLASLETLREANKLKEINEELLEQLASSLRWLLRYSRKHNISLPEKEKISALIDKVIETYQPTGNTTNYQPTSKQNHTRETLNSILL